MNVSPIQDSPSVATRPPSSISEHLLSAASISLFLSALAVLHYLLTTQFGSHFWGTFIGEPLISYVIGANHNMDTFAAEALFVVSARFLITFGLTWFPLALLIRVIRR